MVMVFCMLVHRHEHSFHSLQSDVELKYESVVFQSSCTPSPCLGQVTLPISMDTNGPKDLHRAAGLCI